MGIARISASLLFLFAVALQIQITLFASDDYIGLRANLADLLLPLAGLFIIGSPLLKRSVWPKWQTPFGYWAPALLTIIIGFALVNGYWIQGSWSHWALFNKGIGWCVLMAYLLAGAWFATNQPETIARWFIPPFIVFLVIVIIGDSLIRILYIHGYLPSLSLFAYGLGRDLAGFMVNRNAFAFLYLCALILASMHLALYPALARLQKSVFAALWFLLPLFLVLNLSRASLLVLAPLALYLLFSQRRVFLRLCLPLVIAGLLLVPLANFTKVEKALHNLGKISHVQAHVKNEDSLPYEESVYRGDQVRIQIMKDSWALIKEHPLTGAGIGTALKLQQDEKRQFISVIDNTPLWILTEMGPLGLLGFAGVYICMFLALLRKRHEADPKNQAFVMSVALILLAFGIYSLFHEILYARFFWFILGLSLALPTARPQR
ncbi:MAG: O-antigen ligase family protein [Alphaproteobacteria bacterium]|nr:O-antigen ligase family protein [Alphaproteobacteria bacterium]